jgi:cell division protein FtsZ
VIFGAVIDQGVKDEVRVTVIATGFGPERYRRRRREERPAEEGVGTRAPTRDEGAFEVPEDVLEVPSFLRDA